MTTALITGGCRGIGYGIAQALAEQGFNLALTGTRPQEDSVVQAALSSLNQHCTALYFQQDLSELAGHQPLIAEVLKKLGSLETLVLNAAIAPATREDLLDMKPASFDKVLGTNLRGSFFLAQAVAQKMLAAAATSAFRSIVFITSVSATMASTARGEYCISKAGTSMAAQLFAARLAAAQINVYELRPGIIATEMTAGQREKYNTAIAEGLVPLGRWGEPKDIGAAVAVLARGDLAFATGGTITVDGGLSIQRL